jgi:RNA polymerase sigma-70 factor (ECF subfamily)
LPAGLSHDAVPREEAGVGPDRIDDTALLLATARGEQTAFAVFYRRWLPIVTGFHLRRVRNREVAFDLTAETFAAVVAGVDGFDPARGPAAAWLFGIADHKLGDSIRRSRVEASARRRLGFERIMLDDEDLGRVDELASLGDAAQLEELLAELPQLQRAAIRARVLDEKPYAAVAVELSCSEAVARQSVHRGLRRLRERLKETA